MASSWWYEKVAVSGLGCYIEGAEQSRQVLGHEPPYCPQYYLSGGILQLQASIV